MAFLATVIEKLTTSIICNKRTCSKGYTGTFTVSIQAFIPKRKGLRTHEGFIYDQPAHVIQKNTKDRHSALLLRNHLINLRM